MGTNVVQFRTDQQIANQKEQRQKQRFSNKSSQTSSKYLRRIGELTGAPGAMEPFTQVLRNIFVDRSDVPREKGQKTVGTYCVMAPHELIYAAGALPLKLCSGDYTAFAVGDDVTPRDACPLVKAISGYLHIGAAPLYDNCSMMVVPVTCDCKKKIAGMLERSKNVMTLHVPADRGDMALEQYTEELYRFAAALEKLTGSEITYETLAEAMGQTGYAQYELSRFLALKKRYPYLVRGTHTLTMLGASSYMPALSWGRAMGAVNDELEQRAKAGAFVTNKQLPRILVTGSPIVFPNFKIPLLIEELGGHMAADETCMGERGMSDPVIPTDNSFDGMMRALANRALRPCSCPTFADNSQRIYRLRQMIQDHRIEGVIYHVLRGCLVYDFEYKQIEDELGKMGIPVIRLESDYNEEDVEQLRIRIEAFIELIKLSKKRY